MPGPTPAVNRAVIAGGENVGEQGQILDLRHRLLSVRELDQVEIGVGNQNVFRLSADPSTHVDIAVSGARTRRIHGQTDAGLAFAAIAAASAGDVERNGDKVALLQEFDVNARLDHFARDFVTQDQTLRSGGAAAHHVLVGPADVGRDHFQNDAVGGVFAAERIGFTLGHSQFGIGDGLYFHLSRLDVRNATIRGHMNSPFYLNELSRKR